MNHEEATQYDAQKVYLETEREGRVPGNIPAAIHKRVEARLMDEVLKTAESRLSNHPGFSRIAQMWNTLKTDEKVDKIDFLATVDEVAAAMSMEMEGDKNNEILELLISRKRAIEEV